MRATSETADPASPPLPAPFGWCDGHVAIDLPGGGALFSSRRGGVSQGSYASLNLGLWTEDDPVHVAENRRRLAAVAGALPERLAFGRQVHEAVVELWREPPSAGAVPREADGQATSVAGVVPLVLTADCLPVALVAEGAVAMLHAGWRGLAAGILGEGVAALRALGAAGPVYAAIGPGAGVCCYEAGDAVHAAFADRGAAARAGRHVDLKAVARIDLEAADVAAVHDVGLCTICSDPGLFFSHRRDGGRTGRQAGIAWLS